LYLENQNRVMEEKRTVKKSASALNDWKRKAKTRFAGYLKWMERLRNKEVRVVYLGMK